ncbi:hypothetical protein LC76P1_00064 [Lysinibacillus phage LC76P1]|nr:hypothetical protein LC76P1_00064 [Lysinibacillus phage LC76P1]
MKKLDTVISNMMDSRGDDTVSLNAVHIDVMFFSTDSDRAYHAMKKFIYDNNILPLSERKSGNEFTIETNRGRFRARVYNQACRGYRYNEVHIDRKIDSEHYQYIEMKVVPPCGVDYEDWMSGSRVFYY